MKLVTYNIQYGIGRDGKYDLDRIAAAVDGADIIALQEVTRNFPRNNGVDMVADLCALLPDYFAVFAPGMDIDFGIMDKGKPVNGKRLQFGNMVLSRWQIASTRNLLLPRTRTYTMGNFQRAALETLIISPSGPLRFYSVHLDHINHDERIMQVRHLKERVLAYPLEGGGITGAVEYGFPEPPCPEEFVLMGDFNFRPGRAEYIEMTGAPDSVFGHRIVAHNPVDAARLADDGPEETTSWFDPADPSRRARLDYCFVSAGLAPRVKKEWIDDAAEGSDHMPVWVEMD